MSSADDRRRGGGIHFPVGTAVEVRPDEKGLEGVYFLATVIPPDPSPTNSVQKRSRRGLHVEYETLLAKGRGQERLREYVDLSYVRPAPPALQEEEDESERGFKVNDVVDAFYKDGWWTGVVSRVVEGGEKVAVKFMSPPDELEFGISDLRAHWDWVNGLWVKQQSVGFMETMNEVGTTVEISLEKGSYRDALIHHDLRNGLLSVECEVERKDVMVEVNVHDVRPCPPVLVDDERKLVLSKKIDAYFDYAWWSGVITKKLENNRYIVLLDQAKQEKEFDKWSLRPHMDWKDGKWLLQSSFSDDGDGDQNSSASAAADGRSVPLTRKRLNQSDSATALKKLKEGSDTKASAAGDQSSNGNKTARKQRSVRTKLRVRRGEKTKRKLQEKEAIHGESGEIVQIEESSAGEMVLVNKTNNEFDKLLLEWIEPEEMKTDGEKQNDIVMVDDDDDDDDDNASSMVDKSAIVPIEPQTLLPCVQRKIYLESSALPFERSVHTASLWEQIESMRVFKRIPQKPHFQPLEQINESLREGLAIGSMVSFATLVEKACQLQINDPKNVIDGIMERLGEIEMYGFDASLVRGRLTEVLTLKAKQEKLIGERNNLNNNIEEHGVVKSKAEEEIGGIKEQMNELQVKLSVAESVKEKEEGEIASLRAGLEKTEESIKIVGSDFDGVVSSILRGNEK